MLGGRKTRVLGIYKGPSLTRPQEGRGKSYKGGFTEEGSEPLNEEAIKKLRAERNKIDCSCMGDVENCHMCYRKGSYIADGFGNRI